MTGLAATVLLQTALLGVGAQTYEEAFKEHEQSGKPLLVLVSADWCPACQVMKNGTLARMERSGKLNKVAFSIIDTDRDRVAGRLMRGSSIPQLILFTKTDKGWDRQHVVGAQSESQVQELIGAAIEKQGKIIKPASAVRKID